MANVHTMADLYELQALPLNLKIAMTMRRIRDWVNEYGEEGVYVSFSGGKDSTVLLDIVRNRCGYKKIPAVFVDVPTQYPELREFAETFDNVVIVKPKMSFAKVCEKYGFPIISKQVAKRVWELNNAKKKGRDIKETEAYKEFMGIRYIKRDGFETDMKSFHNKQRHRYLMDANFLLSHKCCDELKKKPIHIYQKETGRVPITGQMASESINRASRWLKYGCNSFGSREPMSNPLSFWTEQDVLAYIYLNKLRICSVYGEVVEDWDTVEDVEGQLTISDLEGFEDCGIFDAERPMLRTTGCDRTGCVLCGFGCHMEKEGKERFLMLKETHPKFHNLLYVLKNNGVTYAEAIDWINEHGNFNIKY